MTHDTKESVEVIQELYTVLKTRDFERTTALLHPNMTADTPPGQVYIGGHYQGRANVIKGIWGRLGESWDPITPNVAEFLDCGNGRVLALGRYDGVLKANGNKLDAPFAHLWTVQDGNVVHLQVYTDTAIWNKAWGQQL